MNNFACSLLMSLLCLLPSAANAAAGPARINIGVASVSSSALSLWVAEEQRLFVKYGIDPQLILIRGGPTLVASLLTGEIQAAFTTNQEGRRFTRQAIRRAKHRR